MTYRNLFNIVIKILGIFFLKTTIELIPQFLQLIQFIKNSASSFSTSVFDTVYVIFSVIAMLAFDLIFSYVLIFKSNYAIDKLKLTSGFDQETIPMETDRKTIIGISVIIIGGLILADSVPLFLKQVYNYYIRRKINLGMPSTVSDTPYLILYGAKIIVGLLLMGEQKRITGLIYKYTDDKRNTPDSDNKDNV